MKLHVTVRGTGPDLVLLHGWGLNGACWGRFADRLAEHWRVHEVDLPGHGRSAWHAECTGLDGVILAVRRHVPEGATVLGWSLGGIIALRLAQLAGPVVGPLVLVATTPRFTAGRRWPCGMARAQVDAFGERLAVDYRRTLNEFLTLQVRGEVEPHRLLRELKTNLARGGPPQPAALDQGLDLLRSCVLRPALPGIGQPALVVAGESDRLTPPQASQYLAQSLPNARLCTIERAGHAPFLSHGTEVLDAMIEFAGFRTPSVAAGSNP